MNYHSTDNAQLPPLEYLPATEGETYETGEALVMTNGGLTKCGPTARPAYLCEGKVRADGLLPVTRISVRIVYDAQLSAEGTALKLGDRVTLAAGGVDVTATTTGGVAEIVRMDGTAAGDLVGVRFPETVQSV